LSNARLTSPSWLALVRFFRVLEVDDVGVVNVTQMSQMQIPSIQLMMKVKPKVLMAIPPLQIDGKSKVEDVDGDPSTLKCWRRWSQRCRWRSPHFKLVETVVSIASKLMAKSPYGNVDEGVAIDVANTLLMKLKLMAKPLAEMLMKVLLMTPKSLANPLVKILAKAVLLITKL
jgi:hypothetical protein